MKGQGNWKLSPQPGVLCYEHKGGVYAVEAVKAGWIILKDGTVIGKPFKTSEEAGAHVEQVLLKIG